MSTAGQAWFDEISARQVLGVRAVETEAVDEARWSREDAAWATRLAQQTVGTGAGAARYLSERARHASERLRARGGLPALPAADRAGAGRLGAAVLAGAFVLGLVIDRIGPAQQVNLLVMALSSWAVVGWSLAVYLWLIVQALRRRDPGGRMLGRLWQVATAPRRPAPDHDPVARRHAALWAEAERPRHAAQAAALLHGAAALLAIGLLLGLYLRGLVLDYRAGWQSTFLEPATVRAALAWMLGPASALTGIAIPPAETLATLRLAAGEAARGDAAPWIHLYAATLLLAVVGPRAALAGGAAVQARRRAQRIALPLHEPYYQRLLRRGSGRVARVQLLTWDRAPTAGAIAALRERLEGEFGDAIEFEPIAGSVAGDGGPAPEGPAARPDGVLALVSMAATPEDDVHGRALRRLVDGAGGLPVRVIVDESSFVARFAAFPQRVAERRAAWTAFVRHAGAEPLFADLSAHRR